MILQAGGYEEQTPRNGHVVSTAIADVYLEALEEDKDSVQKLYEIWNRQVSGMAMANYSMLTDCYRKVVS
ncbi:MAG TPA: hypothetical protein DEG28_04285 [Porphyromonadaceae bacterium]|nr:hypothetical protein [Porphyromonadaceae bacterium]